MQFCKARTILLNFRRISCRSKEEPENNNEEERNMAELKTRPNNQSVQKFLSQITDDQTYEDCLTLIKIMKQATKEEPKMWGPSIVGFGSYHFKYESGREGDWFLIGFSPRKQNLTLYIMAGFERYDALMKRLGTYKTGKSCLYLKRLADVDIAVLKTLVQESVQHMKKKSPK